MTVDDCDLIHLGWAMQDMPQFEPEWEYDGQSRKGITARILINWYDAAVFCLNRADFMRNHDKRAIQAIAMLTTVSNNIGDGALQMTFRSAAIRIGQSLRLGSRQAPHGIDPAEQECERRLWWTLLICEWLAIPYRPPCIGPHDFDVELPQLWDNGPGSSQATDNSVSVNNQPDQVQYHLAMSSIARIHQAFRASLVHVAHSAHETLKLVQRTDDALAKIIDTLPAHLRNDSSSTLETATLAISMPQWAPLQRNQLALVLLYYRMVINRVMQDYWIESPQTYTTSQAICIGSAKGITSLIDEYKPAEALLRPW